MKILVTGASGTLGSLIAKSPGAVGAGRSVGEKIDITNRSSVLSCLHAVRPDWVVHCAAMVGNDICGRMPFEAWDVNANGTKIIAEACSSQGIGLLYVSTAHIFDGTKGFYKEDDAPNPKSVYGRTKLAGEYAASMVDNHIIVRLSLLYGSRFLAATLEKFRNPPVQAVRKNYLCPTHDEEAAAAILKLITNGEHGVFHLAADRMERIDFMNKIAGAYNLDKSLIQPVDSLFNNAIAKADMSLDSSKAYALGIKFSGVENVLKRTVVG